MFTSRAEYRLLLREDNADFRLRDLGYRLGLVPEGVYRRFCERREQVEQLLKLLDEVRVKPEPHVLERLREIGSAPIRDAIPMAQLLKRSDIFFEHLGGLNAAFSSVEAQIASEVETRVKYAGYIERQERDVEQMKRLETLRLPQDLDYGSIHGLTTEVKEKLTRVRPLSLGQASRIPGVTPAALMAVHIHLKRGATQPGTGASCPSTSP